ncbi:unnamed protein product [Prorocentrum cordatum]|uniref:Uncharacterized protein n=1 Tax=Prorocentrum cordatum TaxID=2364126 RepID=A0ABN9UZX8_9DINO|nr:unnamed protein product [Polarella glacialis]
MVRRLAGLGFRKVHNVNEDFYAVIESGKLPEHDLILSSPPYSGDHLERCLRFCGSCGSAWALLLPNWVQSRPYFREVLGSKSEQVFYIRGRENDIDIHLSEFRADFPGSALDPPEHARDGAGGAVRGAQRRSQESRAERRKFR